ncbi:hypothetical protein BN1263130017 [Stenotrophomonas indicatrix]|nr:hypothetical protein BN1263130017 [Stenotrophomonas indicatrix]
MQRFAWLALLRVLVKWRVRVGLSIISRTMQGQINTLRRSAPVLSPEAHQGSKCVRSI